MEVTKSLREMEFRWIRSHEIVDASRRQVERILVDVRTPGEFEEAHIPDSTNVPLADLEQVLADLERKAQDKQVVLVCRTHNRVKVAFNHLVQAGLTNCHMLEGGITGWIADGHPVIMGSLVSRFRGLLAAHLRCPALCRGAPMAQRSRKSAHCLA